MIDISGIWFLYDEEILHLNNYDPGQSRLQIVLPQSDFYGLLNNVLFKGDLFVQPCLRASLMDIFNNYLQNYGA